MEQYKTIKHTFEPVWNEQSEILILGTFPSVKSRENQFYYGHPQNRFWKLLAGIYEEPVPETVDAKKELILKHHLAVWDVIGQCDITGSSDSSIRNVIPADIAGLLAKTSITAIFGNGNKACELFQKYTAPALTALAQTSAIQKLPSTSPANAAWRLDRLCAHWQEKINPFLIP